MTDIPDPCQSSISSRAFSRTGCGKTAGPALKLNTLPNFCSASLNSALPHAPSVLFVVTIRVGLIVFSACARIFIRFCAWAGDSIDRFRARVQNFTEVFAIDDLLQ